MTLDSFFRDHPAGALAFSGGTDSSLLALYAARSGGSWRAYYVHTPFQPAFELADARRVCRETGLPLAVLEADPLCDSTVADNPPDRCYHCKRLIFRTILAAAARDGLSLVIDGTNASDPESDRPGMRALRELSVMSPLRECGITKADVRRLSREDGLFTWNKPSYACLATRIPTGTAITKTDLASIETAEDRLRTMGFSDLRVRLRAGAALLQVPEDQLAAALDQRSEILSGLEGLFSGVWLDLKPRKGE